MYLSRAENYDKECAESWKADADSILIFVRPRYLMCTSTEGQLDWPILCNCSGLRDWEP